MQCKPAVYLQREPQYLCRAGDGDGFRTFFLDPVLPWNQRNFSMLAQCCPPVDKRLTIRQAYLPSAIIIIFKLAARITDLGKVAVGITDSFR